MNNWGFPKSMISEVAFRTDVHKYDKTYFCLYVEGKTDKVFYERILKDNVTCRSVAEAVESDGLFRMPGSNRNTIIANAQAAKFESPPCFGVVDRDNSTEIVAKGVFYTDTRDLETLLIYTDDEMYQKIDPTLTLEEVKSALFMAYQFGYLTDAWKLYKNKGIDIIENVEKCYDVNNLINIEDLRYHLKRINARTLPSTQEMKQFKKNCNKISGVTWNEEVTSIAWDSVSGVWDYIKGHDFVYFLVKKNESLSKRIRFPSNALEYELINKYNVECFKKCSLYYELSKAELISI